MSCSFNVFVYCLLRGLATKLANFYEPLNIQQEYSQVGKNLAINYTRRCKTFFIPLL